MTTKLSEDIKALSKVRKHSDRGKLVRRLHRNTPILRHLDSYFSENPTILPAYGAFISMVCADIERIRECETLEQYRNAASEVLKDVPRIQQLITNLAEQDTYMDLKHLAVKAQMREYLIL